MSREAARLARTNRLPPLILYDVAVPRSRPSTISLALSLSLSLSVPPYSQLFIARGSDLSGQCVGHGYRGPPEYFTAPDVSKAPLTLFQCTCRGHAHLTAGSVT